MASAAALVIQGSACIYSKKVEYLHKLVYQALEFIAEKRCVQQESRVAGEHRSCGRPWWRPQDRWRASTRVGAGCGVQAARGGSGRSRGG